MWKLHSYLKADIQYPSFRLVSDPEKYPNLDSKICMIKASKTWRSISDNIKIKYEKLSKNHNTF